MSREQGRAVPWADWSEWDRVRLGLFSKSEAECIDALEQVSVWRSRGRLPVSVDATASLLDVAHRDSRVLAPREPQSELQLRLQYAMITVRLVSGVIDSLQRGQSAVSVALTAQRTGFPRLLVDVRHDATHNELPSLEMLRLAAGLALDWLRASYWDRQAEYVCSNRDRVGLLVRKLMDERRAAANSSQQTARPSQPAKKVSAEATATSQEMANPEEGRPVESPEAELKVLSQGLASSDIAATILEDGALPDPGSASTSRAEQAALEAALDRLCHWFGGLSAAILLAAVQRMVGLPAAAGSGTNASPATAEVCIAWVRHILLPPSNRPSRGKSGGQNWRTPCDPAQIRALSALCLRPSQQSYGEAGPGNTSLLLRELRDLLTSAATGTPPAYTSPPLNDSPVGVSQAAIDDAAASAPDLEGLCADATADMLRQRQALERAREAKHRESNAVIDGRSMKWSLAHEWTPCCVGNLPSVHSESGQASTMTGRLLQLA